MMIAANCTTFVERSIDWFELGDAANRRVSLLRLEVMRVHGFLVRSDFVGVGSRANSGDLAHQRG